MTPRADVLLITVNSYETAAVLEEFKKATGSPATPLTVDDRVYHHLGTVSGMTVYHGLSEMGSGGPGGAHQTTDKAIRALNPVAIVAVGLAFGINPGKERLGEILIAKQLRLYDLQRAGNQLLLRGDRVHASSRLINFFEGAAQASWKGPTIHAGLMLTGDKLIDNVDYRGSLTNLEPEAIGGEMEGAGVYVAAHDHKTDWIIIKAICDWADGTKSKNKASRQQKAASNAARFLIHALNRAPLHQPRNQSEPPPSSGTTTPGRDNTQRLDYISQLYKTLGHSVHKAPLSDTPPNYFTTQFHSPGVGDTRLYVSYASPEMVNSRTLIHCLQKQTIIDAAAVGCDKVIIVTDKAIRLASSPTDRAHVQTVNITVTDLEEQLLSVRHVFTRFVTDYEAQAIFHSYVPLTASQGFASQQDVEPTHEDVCKTLIDWLIEDTISYVGILGDYGVGKTTLLTRIKYLLVKRHLRGRFTRKPILIELRNYEKYKSLDALLAYSLVKNFEREIPVGTFWEGARRREYVFLLDGFDEIVSRATDEERRRLFHEFGPLFHTGCTVLLTCRPSYFVSAVEYNSLIEQYFPGPVKSRTTNPSAERAARAINQLERHLAQKFVFDSPIRRLNTQRADVLTINEFNEAQIDRYLEKHDERFTREVGITWRAVKEFLLSVYDLRDLMRRPIILGMIVETVLHGDVDIKDKTIKYGPFALYQAYTEMELYRDWEKGQTRRLLSKELRKRFAIAIALTMYAQQKLEVSHEQIVRTIEDIRPHADRSMWPEDAELSAIATDIRTCAFLGSSGEDLFRFAHRSFMEYFVALHIREELESAQVTRSSLLERDVPFEILYFLGGLAVSDSRIADLLRVYFNRIEGTARSAARRNGIIALLFSHQMHEGLKILNIEIYSASFLRLVFRRLQIGNSGLRRIGLRECLFEEAEFDNVRFEECSLIDCSFVNSTFKVELLSGECTRMSVSDGGGSFVAVDSVWFDDCKLSSTKLTFKGPICFRGGRISHSSIFLDSDSRGGPVLESITCADCVLTCHSPRSLAVVKSARFLGTCFEGIRIVDGRSLTNRCDSACSGFIFVRNLPSGRTDDTRTYRVVGNIVFVMDDILDVKTELPIDLQEAIRKVGGVAGCNSFERLVKVGRDGHSRK